MTGIQWLDQLFESYRRAPSRLQSKIRLQRYIQCHLITYEIYDYQSSHIIFTFFDLRFHWNKLFWWRFEHFSMRKIRTAPLKNKVWLVHNSHSPCDCFVSQALKHCLICSGVLSIESCGRATRVIALFNIGRHIYIYMLIKKRDNYYFFTWNNITISCRLNGSPFTSVFCAFAIKRI